MDTFLRVTTKLPLLIFDWGGTIMVDYTLDGPMYLWPRVAWVEGAKESLETLFDRYPMVIATNAPHSGSEEMVKALERVGAARFFHRFYSSKELDFGKPDPRFFLAIASKENVDPRQCIMIGNHYTNDIEGAWKAGMRTVFYNEKGLPEPLEMANQVILTMRDLDKAIDQIIHGK